MDIFLIRHTTPDIDKGTCYGASDIPLADSFIEEANSIQAILPTFNYDAIVVSSPLVRCYELTKFLVGTDFPITVENRLKEMSFGDWELQPWNAIDKVQLKSWFPNFVTSSPPNGETFQAVYNRATEAYEYYTQQNTSQLFLVAHSAIIRALLCQLQQSPLKDAFKKNMDYGVVFHIKNDEVIQLK